MTSSTASPSTTSSPRSAPGPSPRLVVAARIATAATALIPAGASVVAGVAAARAWVAAGPRGLNDPDLHGIDALFASIGTLLAGGTTLLLVIALVRQLRPASRRSGTRLAGSLHVPLVLVSLPWLLNAGSPWTAAFAVLVVVDGMVVWFAVFDDRRRACRAA